ncbi:MAG: DUF6582 domain-containing protein [Thermomicrobiales bacterium]
MSEASTLNGCGQSITRRPDINPEEGIREYGDVTFADPVNNKYPVDTREHIEAGWRYIHKGHDQSFYSPQDVACIESRIKEAGAAIGLTLHP